MDPSNYISTVSYCYYCTENNLIHFKHEFKTEKGVELPPRVEPTRHLPKVFLS